MKKKILFAVIGLLVILGVLAGIKALQIQAMVAQGEQFVMPPEIVTSAEVKSDSWESTLTAVGSLDAVQGVNMTAEISGKVVHIGFEAGDRVAAGDLLVQQDISVENAELRAAKARLELARINFERFKSLLPKKAISQSDYDNSQAQFAEAQAKADNIRAQIAKKTIRAPFAGRLGIRQINLGQIINDGQDIVSLQSLDPVFVNFLLPQQKLPLIGTGLEIRALSDAVPGHVFTGTITTIAPEVDVATRNIRVQAELPNPDEILRAGMFVTVTVVLPKTENYLTIPATSVLYAPYSDSVFVIEEKKNEDGTPAGLAVRQQFVSLGEKRGDFVVVKSGLSTGETIVSTGVFKLRNGQSVVVDNELEPEFKLDPQPAEG